MARSVSSWVQRVTNTGTALFALAIFLLFTAFVLPAQSDRAEAYTGDARSPDTSFFYSPGDLYSAAQAYGEDGRRAYVRSRFTFDAIWPLVYMLFLTTAISWVFGRTFAEESRWRLANLVPIAGALFDYLENVATSIVMLRYPERTPVIDTLAPGFTLLKWLLIGGSFSLLLIALLVGAWRWIRKTAGQ